MSFNLKTAQEENKTNREVVPIFTKQENQFKGSPVNPNILQVAIDSVNGFMNWFLSEAFSNYNNIFILTADSGFVTGIIDRISRNGKYSMYVKLITGLYQYKAIQPIAEVASSPQDISAINWISGKEGKAVVIMENWASMLNKIPEQNPARDVIGSMMAFKYLLESKPSAYNKIALITFITNPSQIPNQISGDNRTILVDMREVKETQSSPQDQIKNKIQQMSKIPYLMTQNEALNLNKEDLGNVREKDFFALPEKDLNIKDLPFKIIGCPIDIDSLKEGEIMQNKKELFKQAVQSYPKQVLGVDEPTRWCPAMTTYVSIATCWDDCPHGKIKRKFGMNYTEAKMNGSPNDIYCGYGEWIEKEMDKFYPEYFDDRLKKMVEGDIQSTDTTKEAIPLEKRLEDSGQWENTKKASLNKQAQSPIFDQTHVENEERWAFTQAELEHPENLNSNDEFVAVIDPKQHLDTSTLTPAEAKEMEDNADSLGVIVKRNGKATNRFDDGTVGVTPEIQALAEETENMYKSDLSNPKIQEVAEYRDVIAGKDGKFIRFAIGDGQKKYAYVPEDSKGAILTAGDRVVEESDATGKTGVIQSFVQPWLALVEFSDGNKKEVQVWDLLKEKNKDFYDGEKEVEPKSAGFNLSRVPKIAKVRGVSIPFEETAGYYGGVMQKFLKNINKMNEIYDRFSWSIPISPEEEAVRNHLADLSQDIEYKIANFNRVMDTWDDLQVKIKKQQEPTITNDTGVPLKGEPQGFNLKQAMSPIGTLSFQLGDKVSGGGGKGEIVALYPDKENADIRIVSGDKAEIKKVKLSSLKKIYTSAPRDIPHDLKKKGSFNLLKNLSK